MGQYLDSLNIPSDIKKMTSSQIKAFAEEIRSAIIETISKNGGHLASNLGVVELTLALYKSFNPPSDKIIWDVGHQSYAHKLITGRKDRFKTIRTENGLSGFPNIRESEYDAFGTGHATTSISAALGIAAARDLNKEKFEVVAVIGDGALTGGMAYEALNNAAETTSNLTIVLNDNEMSISKNVGALATHLSHIRLNPQFVKIRKDLRTFVKSIPAIGKSILSAAEKIEDQISYLAIPGVFFESLGFKYFGPFDGHNFDLLVETFEKAKKWDGNKIIHVVTQKGKGYSFAESNAPKFHGTPPFDVESGVCYSSSGKKVPTYTEIFGKSLEEFAEKDNKIVAISAAMTEGTGLGDFAKKFPDRFFDVGIAEEHAVTFAAAMATRGIKPVVALYSTFLQRSFDQIIHDVCVQDLPVVFAVDRAGIVGEDGVTHQGVFDISFLRMIPNLSIMAPGDELELKAMLKTAINHKGPVAIRYPRRCGIGLPDSEELLPDIEIGKADLICEGKDLAILAAGSMVFPSILAAEKLAASNISAAVVNIRSIKPLDKELILKLTKKIRRIYTVEENVTAGGFGSAVSELLLSLDIHSHITAIGLPDIFFEHAPAENILEKYGLTPHGIADKILNTL